MSRLGLLLWLAPRRLRSSWTILAITSFGILAAVTLMAVGPIYSQVLAEAGLSHTVALIQPTVLDAQVIVRNRPISPADYDTLRPKVEQLTDTRLGYMLRDRERSGLLQLDFTLVSEKPRVAVDLTSSSYFGYVFFISGFENPGHTSLTKGRWPQMRPLEEGKGLELEVAVGEGTARSLALDIGSQLFLVPFRDDLEDHLTLTVVGIASAVEPEEEYWLNAAPAYFELQEGEDFSFVPLYLPEHIFFDALATRYPFLLGDFGWRLFLDPGVLDVSLVEPTKNAIVGLDTDVHKAFPRSLVISGLENKLTEYQEELNHAKVPIFIFISLVVVVVLYFLGLATGLLARTQRDEASLLRSRGASVVQVSGLLAAVEAALVVVMVVVGPFLALLVVRHLLLGTLNPTGDASTPPALSPDVFIVAVIGGVLSLAVLTLSGVGLARLGMVEYLTMRARPPTIPLLQRYYIDLLVVAAAALVWWQIHDRGGFVERDLLGVDLQVDPLLLLGPVLALLAATLIVLRLMPFMVRALTRAVLGVAPAWAAISLARVARDPLPHSSLAVMLMMAAALGVFGASFQTTLSENERDRALYALGGDLVIQGPFFSTALQEDIAKTPGVDAVTPIVRRPASFSKALPGDAASLVALDQDTLADTTWFRGDFADKSLSELLKPLQRDTERSQGLLLPADAETVGIWAKVKDLTENEGQARFQLSTQLWMRLADSDGRHTRLLLGNLVYPETEEEWILYEAPVPESGAFGYKLPFSLVSVFLSGDPNGRMPAGEISLDDLTVTGSSTQVAPMDLDREAWATMPSAEPRPDTLQRSASAAKTGRFGLKFAWRDADRGYARGIVIPPGPFPLPAIGGPGLRPGQEVVLNSGGHLLPLLITDVVRYFPTLNPTTHAFALVSLDDYTEYMGRARGESLLPPQELWLSLSPGADRSETRQAIRDRLRFSVLMGDRDFAVSQAERNPLAGGGWNGLTLLGISAMAIAVVLALVTYALVSVRSGSMDLTILKVLGLSRREALLGLTLEKVLVASIGIAAGAGMGVWLAHSVLGLLDRTANGRLLVPPILVSVEAWLVTLVLLELLAALTLATLVASRSASRLKAPDVLRAGQ